MYGSWRLAHTTAQPLGWKTESGRGNENRQQRCDPKREKKYHIEYIYIVSINITIIAKHLNNIHSELSYDVTIINIKTTLYILSFGFAQCCSSPCFGCRRHRHRLRAILILSSARCFFPVISCLYILFFGWFVGVVGVALRTRFKWSQFSALTRKHHHRHRRRRRLRHTHIHICGCD